MSSYTSFPAPTLASDHTIKPVHSLVVDTGPLIKNDPSISTLLSNAEIVYTIPAVLAEIRDPETRSRIDITLKPFLRLRNPRADSIKFVSDFARKTGDLEVLSKPDIHLIALAYEIQCERDGGDWRLRRDPSQKGPNGPNPNGNKPRRGSSSGSRRGSFPASAPPAPSTPPEQMVQEYDEDDVEEVQRRLDELALHPEIPLSPSRVLEDIPEASDESEEEEEEESETESDSEGWITPSNVHKHKAADKARNKEEEEIVEPLEAALLTSDYAMQNVTLRIGLSLLSPGMARIRELRSWILRCHGCFTVTRVMSKQFCPKCGHPTLLRVACSTDDEGQFQIHLKKNFQWNKRGTIYSIPKPTHGTASGKNRGQGGGKNGWGQDLILAEDQKEYARAVKTKQRERKKDLMHEDYLPGIVSGDRAGSSLKNGKIKLGPGRSVNAKRSR